MEHFLCQQIEARQKNGERSIVYTDTEMQNIFTLYDLKGQNYITRDQCREGKSLDTKYNRRLDSFENTSQLGVPLHKGSGSGYPE